MAVDELHAILLQELRQLNEHSRLTGERLSALETSLKAIVGNGQPGKIQQIEARISASEEEIKNLQHWRWGVGGITTVLSFVIPYLIRFLLTGKP